MKISFYYLLFIFYFMIWEYFKYFAIAMIVLWSISVIIQYLPFIKKNKNILSYIFSFSGIALILFFIIILWIQLERPPMRTLGETRLWYSFFLPVIGILTFIRWKYKWFLAYSFGLAILFLFINLSHPEIYSKTLMPALQSPWFVPHVIVYIFSYALLAASSLVAVYGLYQTYFKTFKNKTIHLADNLVYIGFAFLTAGLIFGAFWAKEAWGHYWTWDPKETWAFLTWIIYLVYIHFRFFHKKKIRTQLWILSVAFVILLICWFGINYLPSAANSVHVYS